MVRIRFLKIIDRIFGTAAVCCMKRPIARGKPDEVQSILLLRPGGIGDAVLLIPVIYALRDNFTSAKITILAERRNGVVFSLCRKIDKVLFYDRWFDLLKALAGRYDVVIDTEQWHRLSAVVARFTMAPIVIGYGTNNRCNVLTHPVPYSHMDYEVESFLHLLHPLSLESKGCIENPYLIVPELDVKKAEELLAPLAEKEFVVIFPGASISERRWGTEKFKRVASRLHEIGLPIVVVGGKGEVGEGFQITNGAYGLNLAGRTSITETAAVIGRSKFVISGDSGILHIAVGLGIPTISLFGPGIAKKWAPRGDRHIVLNKNLSCSPCTKFGYTPVCPINAKCMKDITVDEVMAAVEKVFSNSNEQEKCSTRKQTP